MRATAEAYSTASACSRSVVGTARPSRTATLHAARIIIQPPERQTAAVKQVTPFNHDLVDAVGVTACLARRHPCGRILRHARVVFNAEVQCPMQRGHFPAAVE